MALRGSDGLPNNPLDTVTTGTVYEGPAPLVNAQGPLRVFDEPSPNDVAVTDLEQTVTLTGATSGTFTLTFDGEETANIAYNADGAAVESALEALDNITPSEVAVAGSAGGPWTVTFAGQYADPEIDVPDLEIDIAGLNDAVNEVQHVTVDATSGQFKLTFSGQTTTDLGFDSTAQEVEDALVALSNIASGDVDVTGGPGDDGGTTPYVVTFTGTKAATNVAQLTAANGTTPLSGGGASVVVTTQTGGAPAATGAVTLTG